MYLYTSGFQPYLYTCYSTQHEFLIDCCSFIITLFCFVWFSEINKHLISNLKVFNGIKTNFPPKSSTFFHSAGATTQILTLVPSKWNCIFHKYRKSETFGRLINRAICTHSTVQYLSLSNKSASRINNIVDAAEIHIQSLIDTLFVQQSTLN